MSYKTENTILKSLSTQTLEEGATIDELIDITKKYPAFGTAKYLLAKKMSSQGLEASQKYTQNAALYFPDPFWFHFKLNEESLMENRTLFPKTELANNLKPTEFTNSEPQTKQSAPTTSTQSNPTVNVEAGDQPDSIFIINHKQKEKINSLSEEGNNVSRGLTPVIELNQQQLEVDVNATVQKTATIIAAGLILPEDATAELPINKELPAQKQPNIAQTILPEGGQKNILPGEPTANITQIEQPNHTKKATENDNGQRRFVLDQTIEDSDGYEGDEADAATETSPQPLLNDRISSVLQEQAADFKKPVAANTPVPVENEPYHTIDYFASQGIKLTQEQQSQDHLSVKVKKFTDWLKQMKRITPQPTDLGVDEASEHTVKSIAAGSNEQNEVVTETMAEVLVKQGMHEKAIDVYLKLSFLYPAKSTYFATQIDQLKRM